MFPFVLILVFENIIVCYKIIREKNYIKSKGLFGFKKCFLCLFSIFNTNKTNSSYFYFGWFK